MFIDLEWLKNRDPLSASSPEVTRVPANPPARSLTALEQQEYELIARTMASENGGIRRAAAKLGLTHQALLRRLQKWPELRNAASPVE